MADEQSVSAGAGNKWIKITGPSAFLVALVIVLLAVIGYLMNFNLRSWGEPFPIKQAIENHESRMWDQHQLIVDALERNTYVQWACSANNSTVEAKQKCSQVDLMKPESLNSRERRYTFPGR